jgi:hypothetical protein
MLRGARRARARMPSGSPAWGDPSKTAELYLVKIPVGRAARPLAGKLVYLTMRFSSFVIFLVRRAGIAISNLLASLWTG